MKEGKKMKILTISDSFKGTLSSSQVGEIVSTYYQKQGNEADFIPISDGGEGFLEVIHYVTKLPFQEKNVSDPLFRPTTATYLMDENKKTAYLELAQASGLTKIEEDKRNAIFASAYGLGELIKHVILTHHPKKIVLGIGGSATSDVGTGLLEAMGVEFIDANGFVLKHMNNLKLMQIKKIKTRAFKRLIKGIEFVTLTDVTNPLNGKKGCIQVFAKQKGAKEETFYLMERNVLHFYHKTLDKMSQAIDFSGAGAAGGVGYTMKYYFNSQMASGIESILELVDFKKKVQAYDVIITGEGHLDAQSLDGKVISGIKAYHPKRLVIITGSSSLQSDDEIYAIVPTVATLEESLQSPSECLKKLLEQVKL